MKFKQLKKRGDTKNRKSSKREARRYKSNQSNARVAVIDVAREILKKSSKED